MPDTITPEDFRAAVEGDGFDPDSPAQVVVLAALRVGADDDAIAALIGRPVEWFKECADRLRSGQVWTDDGKIVYDPSSVEDSEAMYVETLIHMAIADGLIVRADVASEG